MKILPRHELDVGGIDEGKAELHGSSLDCHVRVFETVEDGGTMALNRGMVHAHRFQQRVERHVADVFVIIQQEAAQDVYSKNPVRRCDSFLVWKMYRYPDESLCRIRRKTSGHYIREK